MVLKRSKINFIFITFVIITDIQTDVPCGSWLLSISPSSFFSSITGGEGGVKRIDEGREEEIEEGVEGIEDGGDIIEVIGEV